MCYLEYTNRLQILRAYRTFGDTEIQILKKRIIENRELLVKVKELQAAQAQNAEREILAALKDTVHRMEDMKDQANKDSASAQEVLKSLEHMEELRMKMDEKKKLVDIMSSIDIGKILHGVTTEEETKAGEKKPSHTDATKKN